MVNDFSTRRRWFWIAILAAAAFFDQATAVTAAAPMQKTQAPGFYRMMVGQIEVTALLDGVIDLDAGLLKNVPEAELRELLARALVTIHTKYRRRLTHS